MFHVRPFAIETMRCLSEDKQMRAMPRLYPTKEDKERLEDLKKRLGVTDTTLKDAGRQKRKSDGQSHTTKKK